MLEIMARQARGGLGHAEREKGQHLLLTMTFRPARAPRLSVSQEYTDNPGINLQTSAISLWSLRGGPASLGTGVGKEAAAGVGVPASVVAGEAAPAVPTVASGSLSD